MASKRVTKEVIDGLRELVGSMVSSIVDHPEQVEVNVVPASYRLLAELHTCPDDVGQVIGRSGAVIAAIRTILAAHGGRSKIKIDLDYVTEHDKG
jgi:predicted RNA-binding protein YlqC (UPF0109 family)